MCRRLRIVSYLTASLAVSTSQAGMVAACGGDPENRVETGSTAHTASGPAAAAELSDANLVAVLDRANVADSSAGAVASAKATSEQVRRFARVVMTDHHGLRRQAAEVSKRLGLTPQPPAYDPVTPRAQHVMAVLESEPKGPDFDRIYIQLVIAAHQEVLDLVDQTLEAAGSPELKAMVEQARPLIENHLKQAQAIEEELGSAA